MLKRWFAAPSPASRRSASLRGRGDCPFPLVIIIIVALAFWYMRPYIQPGIWHANPHWVPSWVGALPGTPASLKPGARVCDLDTYLIHGGLLLAPRFRDTLRWWTGTWAGQVPFYRPLTSWLFWGEWKLFGDNEARYQAVGLCLYLLAVWQFLCFARALYELYRVPFPNGAALLTGLLFVTGLNLLTSQQEINAEVFIYWKNQPDTLCALFICGMMRHYVNVLRADTDAPAVEDNAPLNVPLSGQPVSLRDRWRTWGKRFPTYAALGYYLLSCASKEAGVLLVLLLPILEAPHLRSHLRAARIQALRRLLPLLFALPLFLLWRGFCLHTAVGFQYGSNRAWPYRLAGNSFGIISESITAGAWLELILGAVLCVTLLLLTYRVRAIGGAVRLSVAEWMAWMVSVPVSLVVFGLLASWNDEAIGHNPAVVLMRFALPDCAWGGVKIFVFSAGVYSLIRKRFPLALFTYGWALLILLPTLFSPSVLHRYYLMNMGYALLLGAGLTCWLSGQSASSKPTELQARTE